MENAATDPVHGTRYEFERQGEDLLVDTWMDAGGGLPAVVVDLGEDRRAVAMDRLRDHAIAGDDVAVEAVEVLLQHELSVTRDDEAVELRRRLLGDLRSDPGGQSREGQAGEDVIGMVEADIGHDLADVRRRKHDGNDPGPFRAATAGFGTTGDREGWEAFLREASGIPATLTAPVISFPSSCWAKPSKMYDPRPLKPKRPPSVAVATICIADTRSPVRIRGSATGLSRSPTVSTTFSR